MKIRETLEMAHPRHDWGASRLALPWRHFAMAVALVAGSLGFGFLGLCNPATAQTLRWSYRIDILTLDPHSTINADNNYTLAQVYETLVTRDRQANMGPLLATEWTQVNPLLWRFKLRPGVKFHDGASFTADDVVFSIKRAQQPAAAERTFAVPLGEPRKIDDLTVEFVLSQFNPIFLIHASQIFIMNKAWAEKNSATATPDLKAKEVRYTLFNMNGTGPFTLVSRQPDSKTVFRRNPNWWGKFDGNVQDVVFTPISNDSTRIAALLSGEVDFVRDPSQQDLPRLRNTHGIKVLDGVGNSNTFIGMDQARDELLYSNVKGRNPFKDVRVRRAMYHAIDIETLRTKVMNGETSPTGSMMYSPKAAFNDPELERRLPFDLAKARALMAEAGYPQGFEITLDSSQAYDNIAIALATMWAQIGIKVRPNVLPGAIWAAKGEKLDTSLYLGGWVGTSTDAEPLFTSLMRSRGEGGVGFYNWGNYRDPKFDELALASLQETDPVKREQLIKAALREHQDQVLYIPLHRNYFPWAMRSTVTAIHRADNRVEWSWITVGKMD